MPRHTSAPAWVPGRHLHLPGERNRPPTSDQGLLVARFKWYCHAEVALCTKPRVLTHLMSRIMVSMSSTSDWSLWKILARGFLV